MRLNSLRPAQIKHSQGETIGHDEMVYLPSTLSVYVRSGKSETCLAQSVAVLPHSRPRINFLTSNCFIHLNRKIVLYVLLLYCITIILILKVSITRPVVFLFFDNNLKQHYVIFSASGRVFKTITKAQFDDMEVVFFSTTGD